MKLFVIISLIACIPLTLILMDYEVGYRYMIPKKFRKEKK